MGMMMVVRISVKSRIVYGSEGAGPEQSWGCLCMYFFGGMG